MGDPLLVVADGADDVAFHDLHVIDVVQQLDAWRTGSQSSGPSRSMAASPIPTAARANSGNGICRYGQRETDCLSLPTLRRGPGDTLPFRAEPKAAAPNAATAARRSIRIRAASGTHSSRGWMRTRRPARRARRSSA